MASDDPTLWDMAGARAARDEALGRVEANAHPAWKALARRAALHVAASQQALTTDDVWALLARSGVAVPHEKRAMGAIMTRLGREGLIAPTDRTVNSARREHHAGPVRVWRSLIYGTIPMPLDAADR